MDIPRDFLGHDTAPTEYRNTIMRHMFRENMKGGERYSKSERERHTQHTHTHNTQISHPHKDVYVCINTYIHFTSYITVCVSATLVSQVVTVRCDQDGERLNVLSSIVCALSIHE